MVVKRTNESKVNWDKIFIEKLWIQGDQMRLSCLRRMFLYPVSYGENIEVLKEKIKLVASIYMKYNNTSNACHPISLKYLASHILCDKFNWTLQKFKAVSTTQADQTSVTMQIYILPM